jgi:hypothetical protein
VERRKEGGGERGGAEVNVCRRSRVRGRSGVFAVAGGGRGWSAGLGGDGSVGGGDCELGAWVAEVESCVLALDVDKAEAGIVTKRSLDGLSARRDDMCDTRLHGFIS